MKSNPHLLGSGKYAYVLGDLSHTKIIDVDFLHAFDEAFPPDLFWHVVDIWMESPRCTFFFSTKASLEGLGIELLQRYPCAELLETIQVTKKCQASGPGKRTTGHLYRKKQPESLDLEEQLAKARIWDGEITAKVQDPSHVLALKELLVDGMRKAKETRKDRYVQCAMLCSSF